MAVFAEGVGIFWCLVGLKCKIKFTLRSSEEGAPYWEESFPVRRELASGKKASQWERSFLVEREIPSGGKGAS